MKDWNSFFDDENQNQEGIGRFFSDAENFGAEDIASSELFDFPIDPNDRHNPRHFRVYYVGSGRSRVHFTRREAECIFWIVQNFTIAEAAHKMGLSARTVEFYIKNTKLKLKCVNKKALIEKVLKTDLLTQLEKEGLKIKKH